MSMTAQTRDLNDRKTIEDFAEIVQSVERLKLLLVLTVCDIRGVGPGVWNGWKGQLLRHTLLRDRAAFDRWVLRGFLGRDAPNSRARSSPRRWPDWPEVDRDRIIGLHYPNYLADGGYQGTSAVTLPSSGRSTRRADGSPPPMIKTHAFEGVTEITVLSPDHPRLLSIIAGALRGGRCQHRRTRRSSQPRTGAALDTTPDQPRISTATRTRTRRGQRVGRLIEDMLSGKSRLPDLLAKRTKPEARVQGLPREAAASKSATRCPTGSPSSN